MRIRVTDLFGAGGRKIPLALGILWAAFILPQVWIGYKWLGWLGVVLVGIWLSCATLLVLRIEVALSNRLRRIFSFLMGLGFLVGVWLLYPIANGRSESGAGSDADDALLLASSRLLSGEFPYSERTYLGNPVSPWPGSVLVFALLRTLVDNAALINLIVLFLGLLVLSRIDLSLTFLVTSALFMSPLAWHSLATGNDYIATSVTCACVGMRLLTAKMAQERTAYLWTLPLGVLVASRSITLVIVVGVFAAIWSTRTPREAVLSAAAVLGVGLVVSLPFMLASYEEFSPFHSNARLGGLLGLLSGGALCGLWINLFWKVLSLAPDRGARPIRADAVYQVALGIAPLAFLISVYPAIRFDTLQFLSYGAATSFWCLVGIFLLEEMKRGGQSFGRRGPQR